MKAIFSIPTLAFALGMSAALSGCATPTSAAQNQQSQAQQSQAQTTESSAQPHRHRRNLMNEALSQLQLSDDQLAKIQSLRSDFRAKEQGVTDPDQRRADAKELRQNVLAVLTPDQMTQFKATMRDLRQQQRQQMQAMPEATPAP